MQELELQQIFDQVLLEIYLVDVDTFRIIYANRAALGNLGYSLDELGTMSPQDLSGRYTHSEFFAQIRPVLDGAVNAVTVNSQNVHIRKDGSTYPVEASVQKIRYQNRTCLLGIMQDVTEKDRLLEQLEAVIKGSDIGYWDRDLTTNQNTVNDRWLEMIGLTREDLTDDPRTLVELIHPDDREKGERATADSIRTKLPFNLEFRMRHKDGHWVWIKGSGNVVSVDPETGEALRICGTHIDITEQKLAEIEMQQRERQYRLLAENTDDLIVQYDRDYRIIYVNQALRITHGAEPESFIGKTRQELGFPEELCRQWQQSIEKVFTSGKADTLIFELDVGFGKRMVFWRAFPEFNSQGEVETVFSVSRDVTELKEMEENQQKAERLASLGVLAGGIAHDFNNILTILFGNISMAKTLLPANHASVEALGQAEDAFHRAMHLTSQLLTFAKGGAPIRQDVSIGELIEEVTRFDLSGSNVKLELDLPADLWFADIDRGQVSQVFSNLTINAKQAMPGGGHVYIQAENIVIGDARTKGLAAGRYIRFRVRDEGGGIAAGDLEKIFDPYFSTKKGGSGLGLATVFSVIQKHGGTIGVQSTTGEGTTFEFYLPASGRRTMEKENDMDKQNDSQAQLGRILIMDDEEMITSLAKRILEKDGFEVDVVADGNAAIDAYRRAMEQGSPYDCVIMDLTIPGGMGGAEAIGEILDLDAGAKAIVSSGYAADPIMANYRDYGFSGCLAKPFTLKVLQDHVRDVIRDPGQESGEF